MKTIRYAAYSLIMLLSIACGKSGDKDPEETLTGNKDLAPQLPADRDLPGTYQQAENGLARLEISPENIVVASTLEIPSPAGDGTRLTPRFPQGLIYDTVKGYYSTIGTYNDGRGIFKNIELRLRLYEQNKLLDVTLVTPPDAALQHCHRQPDSATPGQNAPGQNAPGQNNPGQSLPCDKTPHKQDGKCSCPKQLFYVYRFVRI